MTEEEEDEEAEELDEEALAEDGSNVVVDRKRLII